MISFFGLLEPKLLLSICENFSIVKAVNQNLDQNILLLELRPDLSRVYTFHIVCPNFSRIEEFFLKLILTGYIIIKHTVVVRDYHKQLMILSNLTLSHVFNHTYFKF